VDTANGLTFDGDGVDIDIQSSGVSVARTYVHNCDGPGFYVNGSYGSNSVSWCNSASNGAKSGSNPPAGEFVIFNSGVAPTNFLVFGNNLVALGANVPDLYFGEGVGAGCVLANNVFWVSNASYSAVFPDASWTCWNNDYYRGDGTLFSISWNGTGYSTVSSWQSATQKDPHAFTANPFWLNGYVSPTFFPAAPQTSTNWVLSAGKSTLIGAAANLSAQYGINNGGFDFLSNSVPVSGYDLGAVNKSQ
jgi:hypothetical protein